MSSGSYFPPMDDGPPPRRPARTPRPPRQGRSWGQRALLGGGVLVVMGLVVGLLGAGYLWYRYNQIGREDLELPDAASGEPKNYLIVGSDSRDNVTKDDSNAKAFLSADQETAGQRSDTIILLRVDPKAESVAMMSFPRDLWVQIAGTKDNGKINSANNYGTQRLVDTIKQNFDIDVHHYVSLDFGSFKGIVDAVDGVPMYFDKPMRDDHSGLYIDEAGCVTLDGDQALSFSRARYLQYKNAKGNWVDDGTGDLGRIARQQVFMRKVIDRAASQVGALDLKKANDLLSSTADNLTLDSGMDIGSMIDLAREFQGFSGDSLETLTLPVIEWIGPGGTQALKLDTAAAQPVLNVFRGRPTDELSPQAVTVTVQNGSGVSGQAKVAGDALTAIGFQVDGTGNAPRNVSATVVRYAPGAEAQAVAVAEHLRAGTKMEVDRNLASGKVVVVTGQDFTPSTVSVNTVSVQPPSTTMAVNGASAGSTPGATNPDTITGPIGVVPQQDAAAAACS